ncbi:MAG: MAE_28990/MAE_18760 family HEPN-like nuclease [Rhodoglobus sp.]|nr:MAE_28990/MAE_18760 family HEPN-like nuclease [Rhodoglobus sp.]
MKIRTVGDLDARIDQDLVWRRKELTAFKAVALRAGNKAEPVFARAGIAIVYAHWEGFVKTAGEFYVSYVRTQGLRRRELASNFFALSIKKELVATASTLNAAIYADVARCFTSGLDEAARLPSAAVDTGSNLGVDTFHNITILLGLDYSPYATKATPVIEKLLKLRNGVAHGEWNQVDISLYERMHDEVIGMLGTFSDQLKIAASSSAYRVP